MAKTGRARVDIDIEEIQAMVKTGAKCKELAAHYGCHIDTINRVIKDKTEFSTFSKFRAFHIVAGNLIVRNLIFRHAKKDPNIAWKIACNLMPEEFSNKPRGIKKTQPIVQIVDSQKDKDYSDTIRSRMIHAAKAHRQEILIDLQTLLPHQRNFMLSEKRFVALVCGFGAGKTYALLRKVLYQMFTCKAKNGESNGLVIYPKYSLADRLFIIPYTKILEDLGVFYTLNKSERTIRVIGVGTIVVASMEAAEQIVGEEFTYAIADEFDVAKQHIAERTFNKVVGRLRGMPGAPFSLVTTPEGYKFTYNKFVKEPMERPEFDGLIELIRAKSTDNPYLDPDYIDTMRRTYDPLMLLQYLGGEFVNLNGLSAFHQFDRIKHIKVYTKKKSLPYILHISMDFNVNPMTCEVWDQTGFHDSEGKYVVTGLHSINEVTLKNSNTEAMCEQLEELYPNHELVIYPDPAGRQRKSSALNTDIEILQAHGFQTKYIKGIVPIRDSTIIINGFLNKGIMKIDPKCKELILDFEQLITDNDGVIIDDNKNRKHWSDGVRYMCYMLTKFNRRRGYSE